MAKDHYYWFAAYSHLTIDAIGMGYVAKRVANAYTHIAQRNELELTDDIDKFAIFMEEEDVYRRSAAYVKDKQYWLSLYKTQIDEVSLSSKALSQTQREVKRSTELLAPAMCREIETAAAAAGISTTHFVSCIFSLYLHRITGAVDLSVGITVHGRSKKTSSLVGMCANILPVRLTIPKTSAIAAAIQSIAKQLREAEMHAQYRDLRRDLYKNWSGAPPYAAVINVMRMDYLLALNVASSVSSRWLNSGL